MKLRQAIEETGLSVREVARRSGVQRPSIYDVMDGRGKVGYLNMLKLSKTVNREPSEIEEFKSVVAEVEAVKAS